MSRKQQNWRETDISKPAGDWEGKKKHDEKEKKKIRRTKSRRQQPSGAHTCTRSLALAIKTLNTKGRWMSRAEDGRGGRGF